eukprot:2158486-Rhodomonas_salina.2
MCLEDTPCTSRTRGHLGISRRRMARTAPKAIGLPLDRTNLDQSVLSAHARRRIRTSRQMR